MDYARDFEMDLSKLNPNNNSHVNSTIANQLALLRCTVRCKWQLIYRELQPFFRCFSIHQRRSNRLDRKYLEAEPGQYITVARKRKLTTGL
jgi:hypothetical protein